MEKEKCWRCGARNSKIINMESGEEVCDNCGLVYEEKMIDETYEKRNFSQENSGNIKTSSRVGGPLKATDSLGTNLVYFSGNDKKLRTSTANSKTPSERAFLKISEFLGEKGVSSRLIEKTKTIYDEITKNKKMKGRNMEYIIAAIYFRACRMEGIAKSFKEIAIKLSLEEKRIKKSYNFIKSFVVNTVSPDEFNQTIQSYIRPFCFDNNIKKDLENLACDIAKNIIDSNLLEGRSPQTIAGFSLYLANKLIPDKFNINDLKRRFSAGSTLENVYKKFNNVIPIFIPKEYHDKLDVFKINN